MNIDKIIDESLTILNKMKAGDSEAGEEYNELQNKNELIFKIGFNFYPISKFFKNHINLETFFAHIKDGEYDIFETKLLKLKAFYYDQKSKYSI